MNRQTRTWESVRTMAASIAVLLCGMALCTWMGGSASSAHGPGATHTPGVHEIFHLIDPETKHPGNRHQVIDNGVADNNIENQSAQNAHEMEVEKEQLRGQLREAIYALPPSRLKSIGHASPHRLML